MVPSSQRSASSAAAPLPEQITPLLTNDLEEIKKMLASILPERKIFSVLEEAMLEGDSLQDSGFEKEKRQIQFDAVRVYRPRLLVHGRPGMGQQYLAAAVMNHFEGVHVQSFDLATLMSDSTRTPEAAMVQMFLEIKRHQPSVIHVPAIESWYSALTENMKATFVSLLHSIPSTDHVLFFGVADSPLHDIDPGLKQLFGNSSQNAHVIGTPSFAARHSYFCQWRAFIAMSPTSFPDSGTRKVRTLEHLPTAPPSPPKINTTTDLKSQERKDRQLKNQLKMRLCPAMEYLKRSYRKFRKPVIDNDLIAQYFSRPTFDLAGSSPYIKTADNMIQVVESGKKFHNMDLEVMEERMWNGYYCTPRQFLKDLKLILQDAMNIGERERIIKAQEMYTNIQVQIEDVQSATDQQLLMEYDRLYERERKRQTALESKAQAETPIDGNALPNEPDNALIDAALLDDALPDNALPDNALPDNVLTKKVDDAILVEQAGNGGQDIMLADLVEESLPAKPDLEVLEPVPNQDSLQDQVRTNSPMEATPTVNPPLTPNVEQPPKSEEKLPELLLDDKGLSEAVDRVTDETEGCTIEQLERINAVCTNAIWTNRSEWDRNLVLHEVMIAFDRVIRDVKFGDV